MVNLEIRRGIQVWEHAPAQPSYSQPPDCLAICKVVGFHMMVQQVLCFVFETYDFVGRLYQVSELKLKTYDFIGHSSETYDFIGHSYQVSEVET